MTTYIKFLVAFMLTIFFYACSTNDKTNVFKTNLIEKQIGKSDFYISLPPDYFIKETKGPDFSVYYFSPVDTIAKSTFNGNLYFGNSPLEFEADGDSCKSRTIQSNILSKTIKWTIHDCNNICYIETTIDNKIDKGGNEKIHAFGSAKSETDVQKLLDIYATLRQGKK